MQYYQGDPRSCEVKALCGKLYGTVNWYVFKLCASRLAYNSQFAESKLDRVTGGFCGILLNRLIAAGSGGTAPLIDCYKDSSIKLSS